MICLLSFLNIYIYIKFEEFSRVLSYKKQCICIGYVHNFDDFLKFIHSVFYLLIPTCKAKSVFYLLTISFLIFYLLDPYYIYIYIHIQIFNTDSIYGAYFSDFQTSRTE